MDINNIIGTTASLTSIILFGIEIYKITSKNKKSNSLSNVNDNSKTSFDIDLSKNYTTINSINNNTSVNNTIVAKANSNTLSSTNDSNDLAFLVIIFILIGSVISKFYINNRTSIIFWL